MGKWISKLFLGALAVMLSVFTGSRTLDLLAWALPANQVVYQWLGLAAFEGGMYFWSFYFVAGAKGTPQRSISVVMAAFSIVAVGVATVTDMSLDAGQAGKIAPLSPTMSQAAIIFLAIVIAINVAAFLSCELLSIDNLRLMREQSAEDTIHERGLQAITALAPTIASQAAPYLAQEWANRTWERLVPGAQGHTQYIGPAQVPPSQEETPLYRDDQRARRAAPSAGVPLIPDEESVLARPAVVAAPKPRKILGLIPLPGKREEKRQETQLPEPPTVSDVPAEPDPHKEPRRRPASSPVADRRRASRHRRFHPTATTEPLSPLILPPFPKAPTAQMNQNGNGAKMNQNGH